MISDNKQYVSSFIIGDGITIYQEGVSPLGDDIDNSENTDGSGSIDYSELISDSAFVGDYPFAVIMEGISEQFKDYINVEDTNDYVDIFYDQMEISYDYAKAEDEDHPQEIMEALDKLKEKFVAEIFDLFKSKLTISINVIDDETTEEDEVEIAIRNAYNYFILNARSNFMTVISKDILHRLPSTISDLSDNEYFNRIESLLSGYDPLINAITPTEFIQYTSNNEILDMFENGQIAGNFLRKYSAKLYQNEEFKIEIINNITMIQGMKEELLNGEQQSIEAAD